MSKPTGPNKKNLERTKSSFIQWALKEFVEHGYANASTNRIVDAAGMARGSLYYHFKNKQDLFLAVHNHVIEQAIAPLSAAADSAGDDLWEGIIRAIEGYLDLCATKDFRKIILIEAQSALSVSERTDIHKKTIRGIVSSRLEKLAEQGKLAEENLAGIAYTLYGTARETGQALDSSTDIPKDLERYKNVIRTLFEQLAPK